MYLYHEKQDSALCAVHTLNNLLQGEYYSAVELMNIALELDRTEKLMMAEMGTETKDFLKFMGEDSGNVGLDGNFSVEVIKKAIEVMGLATTPLNHPDMQEVSNQPQKEQGFICNLSNHWFAIRNINKQFWDLNSLHKQPVYLSEIYLGAFLKQLQVEGYTIYVVRGKFPDIHRDYENRNWIIAPTTGSQYRPQQQNYHKLTDNDDDDLARAIAASLDNNKNYNSSIQNNHSHGNSFNRLNNESQVLNDDEDLERAIALSIQTAEIDKKESLEREVKRRKSTLPIEPPISEPQITNIMIRLLNGKKVSRRFRQSDILEDIFNWLFIEHEIDISENTKCTLVSSLDKKSFKEKKSSLLDLGLKGNVLLVLEEK